MEILTVRVKTDVLGPELECDRHMSEVPGTWRHDVIYRGSTTVDVTVASSADALEALAEELFNIAAVVRRSPYV
uniref:Uncharacterized protein n=1 Tax=uncultured prokaryote TaxID=198431 RepID=A0A0H5Q7H9_9ZZZZ|nr:hypothetical protein [uncultured prokaryote]